MKKRWIAALIASCAAVSVLCSFIVVNVMQKKSESVTDVLSNAIENRSDGGNFIDDVMPEKIELREENLEELFASASELVTLKYYYTNAADLEKYRELFGMRVPLTTNRTVFTYDGVINAGIDLSDIIFDEIDNQKKTIHITLPYPKVISNELDMSSFEYYDVKNSVFTSISPEEVTYKIDELKQMQEDELKQKGGFYDSVTDNAENVLRNILSLSELTSGYKVTFSAAKPEA
ncbi:MAG: DUF4230 domain-containing protein [Oscillospiraceae bacterium]|nr:DUF4230 domain-containing protein [Oscillospiraceae bacterium]